jgi:hypothetical protein
LLRKSSQNGDPKNFILPLKAAKVFLHNLYLKQHLVAQAAKVL